MTSSRFVRQTLLLLYSLPMISACGGGTVRAATAETFQPQPTPAPSPPAPGTQMPPPKSVPPSHIALSSTFSDHMVLQRGNRTDVFGKADPNTPVLVSVGGVSASAVADGNGQWSVRLPALQAGGPYALQAANAIEPNNNGVTINDVLVGEVWLASGQSNSTLSLDNIAGSTLYGSFWRNAASQAQRNATDTNIRLLHLPTLAAATPQTAQPAMWGPCTPASAGTFSAEAYFFAQGLRAELGVPVGIVEAGVGGTSIRQWLTVDVLKAVDAKQPAGIVTASPSDANLFNGMVAPLGHTTFAGFTWYQGETDAGASLLPAYGQYLNALRNSWRQSFAQLDLPMLIVQLPNFGPAAVAPQPDSSWSTIRNAQLGTWLTDPNSAMVTLVDVGATNTVHPPDKWTVGERLTAAAMGLVYDKPGPYHGPVFDHIQVEGATVRIAFRPPQALPNGASDGLMAGNKPALLPVVSTTAPLATFALRATNSNDWFDGKAVIDGATVVVSDPNVKTPAAVRYGWGYNMPSNLYSTSGFPASPFASDLPPPEQK